MDSTGHSNGFLKDFTGDTNGYSTGQSNGF